MAPILALTLMTSACDTDKGEASQPEAAATTKTAKPETSGTVVMTERGSAMPDTVFAAADFKGKPLLVNLWATWCGPCVAEMPTLDALAKRQAEKLQVIVVSQDDVRNKPKMAKVWEDRNLKNLAPYLDSNSDLGFAFGTGMIPTTVLYDAQGKEVWRVVGAMDWDGPRANTLLSETIG
jgi:thiol-disulfide isomerase/thioredoxin